MFLRIAFSIALGAIVLAACGGKGGGTASIPSSGGGNADNAAALMAQPAPTPTRPTILPNTTGKFGLVQVLDRRMTESQILKEAPKENTVWGTFSPSYWKQAHPGMIISRYLMPFDDDTAISGHDLTWWQQNHPDWILYTCDQNNNPTHYVARDDGFPDVLLDIHNPAVIQYQMQQMEIPYMQANGYNALAADNITFENYTSGPNALLGQSDPGYNYQTDGWYGCGIWEGNSFVRRYSTGYAKTDPAFTADLVNWVQTVRGYLNQAHLHFLVNHPITWPLNSDETGVISNVDGMMYEASFSNWGRYHADFTSILNYMDYVQQNHVAFFVVDYWCENGGIPCEKKVTPSQMDFSLASYQLGNNGGAALYVSASTGDIYSYRYVYATKLGPPCGAYTTPGYSMYERLFTKGLVVVNNSASAAQSINLPSGLTYTDVEGRPISNPLTVQPYDAYVLTTTGNGCS